MRISPEKKIVILAFLAGASMWLVDVLLDKYVKVPPEPFLSLLLYDVPTHVFLMRPILVFGFTLFGILVAFYLKKMKQSEGRYHHLFDSVNDLILVRPFIEQNDREKFIEANVRASQTLGYSREDLLQLAPADLITAEKLPEFASIYGNLREGKHVLSETVLVSKAGKTIPVEMSCHVFDFNGIPSVLSIVRDITERRKGEECLRDSERQLRTLATRLLEVQESERGRITKELHDELGQSLMLMKLQLSSVMHHLRKDQGKLRGESAQILDSVDGLIENIRRLIRDLSPKVLEDLGLTAAIRYLLEELGKHCKIEIDSVDFDNIDQLFPVPAQLGIYRIFQESLTNISRHAKATQVSVGIKITDNKVRFWIKDNGRGFNAEKLLAGGNGSEGIGLATMQERVRLASGQIDIKSREGAGTEVVFNIPTGSREEKDSGVISNRLGR